MRAPRSESWSGSFAGHGSGALGRRSCTIPRIAFTSGNFCGDCAGVCGARRRLYPDRYDVRHLRGMRSLRDFDDQITARYSRLSRCPGLLHSGRCRASGRSHCRSHADPAFAGRSVYSRTAAHSRKAAAEFAHYVTLRPLMAAIAPSWPTPNGYDGRWAERQAIAFLQRMERGDSPKLRSHSAIPQCGWIIMFLSGRGYGLKCAALSF